MYIYIYTCMYICVFTHIRAWSISGGCGIHSGHLQRASAAYMVTQLAHANGEGGREQKRM